MALELGFYTSRRRTIQLNQTQPSPRTVLLKLNFCYQVQTTVVSRGANPSSYNSVATTFIQPSYLDKTNVNRRNSSEIFCVLPSSRQKQLRHLEPVLHYDLLSFSWSDARLQVSITNCYSAMCKHLQSHFNKWYCKNRKTNMAKKMFPARQRAILTTEVLSLSRSRTESVIGLSSRSSLGSVTSLQSPFTILYKTSKSFPKFNATGCSLLIKFNSPSGEQEPTTYILECITSLKNYLVDGSV
jgi:hypothetical protein